MSVVKRRVFPESFKREAVDRVATSGLSVSAVAHELGLHETAPELSGSAQGPRIARPGRHRRGWRGRLSTGPPGGVLIMPAPRTALLRRMRTLPHAGGETLFFKLEIGRPGQFLGPHEVPDFDGETAVFEYENAAGKIRLLRLIK